MGSGSLITIADRFEQSYSEEAEALSNAPEHESPWTGADETLDESVGGPLRAAINAIDEGEPENAKGYIESALDLIKMKRVANRFERLLAKFGGEEVTRHEGLPEVDPMTGPLDDPSMQSLTYKAEKDKRDAELTQQKVQSEENLDFAISSMQAAIGYIDSEPEKAKRYIQLAVEVMKKELDAHKVQKAASTV